MNELQLQRLVVGAVNDAGGFAHKMSNRFLIGVADLIVKLPARTNHDVLRRFPPAGFLEVKQRDAWPKDETFVLEVTRQQGRFLQQAYEAGIPAGVASFIQRKRDILLAVRPWGDARVHGYDVSFERSWHISIGKGEERGNYILTHLYNWVREWRGSG